MANVMTSAKGRSTSPASSTSATVVAIVVPWVSTERGSVSLIERLRISYRFWRRYLRRFSRTRSKMMMGGRAEGVCQRRVHRGRGRLGRALREAAGRPEPRPHHIVQGIAELLDLGVTDPRRVECAAERGGADRLRRLHLDERAARELDRVVQAVYQEQGEAGNDESRRERVGPAAPADEIVRGVGEEADHLRRSGWPCRAGAA